MGHGIKEENKETKVFFVTTGYLVRLIAHRPGYICNIELVLLVYNTVVLLLHIYYIYIYLIIYRILLFAYTPHNR